MNNRLYHGSSKPGIQTLIPQISEHSEPYIYFSTNIIVAAFYTVHKVGRPYNWFPYGFNEDNIPVYNEYYRNALEDVYGGQKGYIYECIKNDDMSNPTNINCAVACKNPVAVSGCIALDDVYKTLLEYEKSGLLIVKRYENMSDAEKEKIQKIIINEIISNNLLSMPDCSYSKFLKQRFPEIWGFSLRTAK